MWRPPEIRAKLSFVAGKLVELQVSLAQPPPY